MNELCHHGILGQKWGVRRYQRTDGSLTDAGKRRQFRVEDAENLSKFTNDDYRRVNKVQRKYENVKSDKIKKLDKKLNDSWYNYQKYVENYGKSNKDTQRYYEHDFDHTKKGKSLINAYLNSAEVRRNAYIGAEWYNEYAKEMNKAYAKDVNDIFVKR